MREEKEEKRSLRCELFLKRSNEPKETRKWGKNKKERGITLIALVITIIILLILAGVTLGTALGENGLIQRAKQAREAYKKAEEEESKGIEQLIDEMGKANGEGGETETSPEPTETTEPDKGHPPKVEEVNAIKAYDEGTGHTITLTITGLDEDDGDKLTYTVDYGTSNGEYNLKAERNRNEWKCNEYHTKWIN